MNAVKIVSQLISLQIDKGIQKDKVRSLGTAHKDTEALYTERRKK
jgi:hypothetical protein